MAPSSSDVLLGTKADAASRQPNRPSRDSQTSEREAADSLKSKGNESFEAGDFRRAVRLYSLALEKDPHNAALYSNRSASYLQGARQMGIDTRSMALRDAEKATELRPSWFKGHARRGDALFKQERFDEALEAYKRAISLDPQNTNIQRSMDECYARLPGKGRSVADISTSVEQELSRSRISGSTGKSAFQLVDELREENRRRSVCQRTGDEYRQQEMTQYRRKTSHNDSSSMAGGFASTDGVPTHNESTWSTSESERSTAHGGGARTTTSRRPIDRSQIPEALGSGVAESFQQRLREDYLRRKEERERQGRNR